MNNFLQRGKLVLVFLFFIFSPYLLVEDLIDPSNTLRLLVLPSLLLIYFYFFKGRFFSPPTYFSFLLILFFANLSIGLITGFNSAEVLLVLAKFLSFTLVLLFALKQLQEDSKSLFWALQVLSLAFIVMLIVKLSQLSNLSRASLYQITIFYEHKNLLASLLFLLLAFSARQSFASKGPMQVLAIFNFVMGFSILLILQVRSVYIALIVTGAFFFYFSYQKAWRIKSILAALIVLTVAAFFYFGTSSATENIGTTAKIGTTASLTERTQMWEKTIQVIKEQPIFGCGAGNWQFNYSKFSITGIADLEKGITAQQPHNELLGVWSEAGTVGLIIGMLLLVFIYRHTFYNLKNHLSIDLLIYLSFFTGILVESCFSFPKERIAHLAMGAILLGAIFHEQKMVTQIKLEHEKHLKTVLILITCFSLTLAFFRARGEYYTKVMIVNRKIGDARGVIEASKKAISPFYLTDPTSSPIYAYVGAAYYNLGKSDSLLIHCKKALQLCPYDPEVLSNLGFALTRYGNQDEARKYLMEALRINPRFEGAWLNLVVLDFSQKKYEDAFLEITRIDDFERKYPEHVKALQEAIAEQ